MASAAEEDRGAYMLYSLFNKFAAGTGGNTAYGVSSLSYTRMKQLMLNMDLMEGVPPGLADVFVREHLQRADQEGSGVIGAQDFIVWLLTEVAALLPVRDAFDRLTGLRPLYNQYHAVLLGDVGFTDGARRPALGMQAAQFQRLAEEYGLSSSAESVRYAFKGARASIGAFRASSGANTGAQMAEPAGGGRLQFAAFVRALAMLAAQRVGSLDAALYQVVSCGVPPNFVDPRVSRPSLSPEVLCSLGLCSRLEGGATKESYTCGSCGHEHQRWRLDSWAKLEELLQSLGIPQPVRRFMPALPYLNARNLRAAFHRYNAMYNRGKMPPASYRLPSDSDGAKAGPAGSAVARRGGANGCGDEPEDAAAAAEPQVPAAASGCAGGGGCCSQPAAYGACCCLFRSLSVMEMSAWLRLCGDCDAIRELIAAHGSGVTPATLESAFVQASAIAGVYCPDDSSGIHDVPIPEGEGGAKLGLPRNHLGAVVTSEARAAQDKPPPKRSTAAYQAPPDGHPMAAPASSGSGLTPRLHEVQGPNTAAAWLAAAKWLPYGGGGSGGAGPAARGQQHRPARLALTFPQFVEALRLVAEEAGGHPTRTAAAERALLRIVHDVVREGCPRPDPTTAAGTAALRRMRSGRADANQPSPAAAAAAEEDVQTQSATSTTTSTKYTYDDFTPPESNLYTSATSSRISSRPNSARGAKTAAKPTEGTAAKTAAASGTSATSTSTKYTYDDFTPPDSDKYTSATSSSSGRHGGGGGGGGGGNTDGGSAKAPPSSRSVASQSWRPQPVKSLGNLKTSYANATVANAAAGGGGGGGSKSTPAQLQPKRRVSSGAVNAPPAGGPPPPPPPPAALWAMTMPSPPSARIQPANPPSQPQQQGQRPVSAPRSRPPTAPPPAARAGGGDGRVEYVPPGYGTTDRPVSRPPAGATRQLIGTHVAGTEPSSYFTAANPPFATRARPSSAQRSRPYSAGDANARSKSPPPSASYLVYPATYAAAAAAAPAGRLVYESPGVSGQPRPSSAPRVRPASANAAGGYGAVPRPLSRSSNVGVTFASYGPAAPRQMQQPPQSRTASGGTDAAAAATAAAGRPGYNSVGRTSGNGRESPAGKGFVAPIFPEPYIPGRSSRGGSSGGGADARPRSPPPRLSATAAATATAMSAEAAASAALAAASAARHSALARPPLPSGPEHSSFTVHPNAVSGGRSGGGGGGSGSAGAAASRGPSATSLPSNAGSGGGSGSGNAKGAIGAGAGGLRNLLLLQAVDQPSTAPTAAAAAAQAASRPQYDNGGAGAGVQHSMSGWPPGAEPWAADAVRRMDSAAERRRQREDAALTPMQKAALEHAVVSPVPVRVIPGVDEQDGEAGPGGGPPPEQPWGGILAAVAQQRDDASSVGVGVGIGFGAGDDEDSTADGARSPRAVLAASQSTRVVTFALEPSRNGGGGGGGGGRASRLPAEGTVNGLPQFFFG